MRTVTAIILEEGEDHNRPECDRAEVVIKDGKVIKDREGDAGSRQSADQAPPGIVRGNFVKTTGGEWIHMGSIIGVKVCAHDKQPDRSCVRLRLSNNQMKFILEGIGATETADRAARALVELLSLP
jgi:hypothetical protein